MVMNDSIKLIVELFSLSGCFWILFYLYSNRVIQGFIVKRYVEETELSNTLFFHKHATFIKNLPDFLSAGFYATHLMAFVWGWGFIQFIKKKRPNISYFNDITHPGDVTMHFSKQEIAKAKRLLISGIIFFLHILIYSVCIVGFPEMFN
jgi:hypothetical protein